MGSWECNWGGRALSGPTNCFPHPCPGRRRGNQKFSILAFGLFWAVFAGLGNAIGGVGQLPGPRIAFFDFFLSRGNASSAWGVISNAIEGVGHCQAPLVSLNRCNLGDAGQRAPSDCIRPAYGSGRPAIRAPEDASALRVQSKRSRPLQVGGVSMGGPFGFHFSRALGLGPRARPETVSTVRAH